MKPCFHSYVSKCVGLILVLTLFGATDSPAYGYEAPGFTIETIVSGLDLPTDMAYASDGRMFIAQKGGTIRVVEPNGTLRSTPFINLNDEVNNAGDRGMLSIALHPNFLTNGYVYLLYTVENNYGGAEDDGLGAAVGRLTRYTATSASNRYVADPSSRLVLLGNTPQQGFPVCYYTHTIGAVRFALDGTLFVSAGDGSSTDVVDYGQIYNSYAQQCRDMFGEQATGAFRSQELNTLGGKVVRIDPATGDGLPDNPFYNGTPSAHQSRIWAMGLRNPFHYAVRPGSTSPGRLFLGDVGYQTYEELNVVGPGNNFGWPCYEGYDMNPMYQNDPVAGPMCDELPPEQLTRASLVWRHWDPGYAGFSGNASIGGTFYTGNRYPASYRGRYFFADYGESWIRSVPVDASDRLGTSERLADNLQGPVALAIDPISTNLVYAAITTGQIRMFRYQESAQSPVAVATANPTQGSAPLTVTFDGTGSYDPNGDALTYQWNLGDGNGSSQSRFSYTYSNSGTYTVTLTVTDTTGRTGTASLSIAVNNTAPQAVIDEPLDGAMVSLPATVQLRGHGVDREQSSLPDSAFSWTVDLHHDDHVHYDYFLATGPTASLSLIEHSDGYYYYEIFLTVRDQGGLTGTDVSLLFPADSGDVRTATLSATRDTDLWRRNASSSFGSAADLAVYYSSTYQGTGDAANMLVGFDLSSIPAGATIQRAQLTLTTSRDGEADEWIRVFRVTRDWNESQANWIRATSTVNWTTAGGDLAGDGSGSCSSSTRPANCFRGPATDAPVDVEVTDIVRAWMTGTANYGFGLKLDVSSNEDWLFFHSREASSAVTRPKLTVQYVVGGGSPPPSLAATRDTGVWKRFSTTNFGGATELPVYRSTGSNDASNMLVGFDLSGIPTGTLISRATLKLTASRDAEGDEWLRIYRVTTAWQEAQATWIKATSTTNWTTAGGDFAGDATGSCSSSSRPANCFRGPASGSAVEVDVTSIVQAWINGTANQGFGIQIDTSSNEDWLYFATREASNTTTRPVLTLVTGSGGTDTDGDGLTDLEEASLGTDPTRADTDSDGLGDGAEVNTYHTDPLDADTDNDGLTDGDEVNVYGTDPLDSDTDNDGIPDGDDVGITLAATQDTAVWKRYPTTTFGSSPEVPVYWATSYSGGGDGAHMLVGFDLSSIPGGMTVTRALLILTASKDSEADEWLRVFRVTTAWQESQATWTKATNTTNWSTPGGDVTGDRSGSCTGTPRPANCFRAPANGAPVQVDVTSIVQAWRSGTANNGLEIQIDVPSSNEDWLFFHTREATTASLRPRLLVR